MKAIIARAKASLWLRPATAGLTSIVVAALAFGVGATAGEVAPVQISENELVSMFAMIASAMLSVATFTLGTIVASASSATASTTHRASRFVLSDASAQNVLSAFVGTFIFALISMVALKMLHFGAYGRFLLLLGLIGAIGVVLIALLRWIDGAMRLGRQGSILEKMRGGALEIARHPGAHNLGAALAGEPPRGAVPVHADQFGFLVAIDMTAQQDLAATNNGTLHFCSRPGDYCTPLEPIAYWSGEAAPPTSDILRHMTIAQSRDPDTDFRVNLLYLAETADRALSPAINDPGTAILVINTLSEIVHEWGVVASVAHPVQFDRLTIAPLTGENVVRDAFGSIARSGAGIVEVGIRLQKCLGMLKSAELPPLTDALSELADEALRLSTRALPDAAHVDRVVRAAAQTNGRDGFLV